MENTIKFLGSITHNNINDIYNISDIFVSLNSKFVVKMGVIK